MEFEFGVARIGQCMFCRGWNNRCHPIRVVESQSLPIIFRVLYTFKNVVCPTCRERGSCELERMTREYMEDYVGG